jgi:hypothetical protein
MLGLPDPKEFSMQDVVNVVGASRVVATPVEYIGKTDEYLDALYGTGLWVRGQVKAVIPEVAAKMLVHIDQYVRADPVSAEPTSDGLDEPIGQVADKRERADSPEQSVRDSIATMDRDGLRNFITTNYRAPVDGRSGVAALREQAVRLVDQFGIAG